MPHEGAGSQGPFAVGLLALHDRAFFERLLADPRRTLTDPAVADLHLTPTEVDEVVRMIERATHDIEPAVALRAWESHAATGRWGLVSWPSHWPPYRLPQTAPNIGPLGRGNRPE